MTSACARAALACAFALACCALDSARGAALDRTRAATQEPVATPSLASGLPWAGKLARAAHLHMNATLRPVDVYASSDNFYATAELVALIERSAETVAQRFPGSQLGVGELSARGGGKIDGHHSHGNGRDADVAFFMRDERGRDAHYRRFLPFDGTGVARSTRALRFDDARNWALVSTLLRDGQARVQYVFVSQPIRTRLLMEARRQGERDDFLQTAAAVMVEPAHGNRHESHFHVRIYCPRDDRPACQDSAPYWPWYDGQTPDGRYDPLPIVRWRMPAATTVAATAR